MDKPGDCVVGPVHRHTQMTASPFYQCIYRHLGRLAPCCFTASVAGMGLDEQFIYKQIEQMENQPVVNYTLGQEEGLQYRYPLLGLKAVKTYP